VKINFEMVKTNMK